MIHYILLWAVLTVSHGAITSGSAEFSTLAACTVAADQFQNEIRTQLGAVKMATVCTKRNR